MRSVSKQSSRAKTATHSIYADHGFRGEQYRDFVLDGPWRFVSAGIVCGFQSLLNCCIRTPVR